MMAHLSDYHDISPFPFETCGGGESKVHLCTNTFSSHDGQTNSEWPFAHPQRRQSVPNVKWYNWSRVLS